MERKFYSDGFERLLKDYADDFKMYPSGKNWHGIYNNLHPGRKWPSLAMGIMLLISLLIVGRLNTERTKPLPLASVDLQNKLKIAKHESSAHREQLNTAANEKAVSANIVTNTSEIAANTEIRTTTDAGFAEKDKVSAELFLNSNNTVAEKGNSIEKDIAISNQSVAGNVAALNAADNGNPDQANGNAEEKGATDINGLTLNNSGIDGLVQNEISSAKSKIAYPVSFLSNNIVDSSKVTALNKIINQKRSKFSLRFNVNPTLTYRIFSGDHLDPIAPNFALAAPNGSVPSNTKGSVEHRPAIGLQLGTELIYDLSRKMKVKAGVQLNYAGYSIHAYSVHPLTTSLVLYDEYEHPYYVSRISSYSSVAGPSPVTLHNQQLQLAFPLGLEMQVAQNGKFKLNAGASLQPTYTVVGTAYVASANNKNYIAESSLMRKWNMAAGFETFLSYKTSGSLTMHVGPQVRYQLLSTYMNKYPYKEHLIDMGLNIGISKSLR